MKTILSLLIISLLVSGCYRAADKAAKHDITLYSCGVQVGHWVSSGAVCSYDAGYHFHDAANGKHVSVSGTVVVTAQ